MSMSTRAQDFKFYYWVHGESRKIKTLSASRMALAEDLLDLVAVKSPRVRAAQRDDESVIVWQVSLKVLNHEYR